MNMDLASELKAKGWNLSKEGLELCKEGLDRITVSAVIQKALDMDLREIGGNFFPEDMKAAKLDFVSGNGVVQVQKIKNASAPKYEYGSGAPAVLRLLLTDGNTFVNCLQWGIWKSISLDTPPGTKLYLKPGKIMMQNSFMLLNENQFTLLGGCVAPMVEKWEICKRLASHVRAKENLDSTGPPPWIPFGKPITNTKSKTSNFRALEQDGKEAKENAVFKQQRLANIAEVSRVKEGKPKVFGGGKDVKSMNTKQESGPHSYSNNPNESSGYHKGPRNYNDFEADQSPRKQENRNDRPRPNQEINKTEPQGGTSSYGQQFTKDKRLDQKNKLNASGFYNERNQGAYERNQGTYNERNQGTYNERNQGTYNERNQGSYNERNQGSYNDRNQGTYNDRNQGTYNERNQGTYQQRTFGNTYRESADSGNSNRRSQKPSNYSESPRVTNNDKHPNSDRRSNNIDDLTQRTTQIKLHGYDSQNSGQVYVPSKPFLQPGIEVMAKYWEDNKFYRAVVHAVGQEGKTCVVHFMDYGNYEEVLVDDVQQLQLNSRWNAGPISFHPSHWESNDPNQDFPAISEFPPNSNRNHGNQDRHRTPRLDSRPSAKLYQPPHQRQP